MSDVDQAQEVIRSTIEYHIGALNETDAGVITNAVCGALSRAGFAYYYQP